MIYSLLKGKILQPRILYPARLSFRGDGEIKNSDKQKLKEFINIKPTLKGSSPNGKEERIYKKENSTRKGKYIVRIEDNLNKPVCGLKDKKI